MNDLISRQAAIDVLEWFTQTDTLGFTPRQIVEALPSAQRTGRWIWDDEGYHCTECFYHAYNATGEIMTGEYKFCPNCGCAMEGEEE